MPNKRAGVALVVVLAASLTLAQQTAPLPTTAPGDPAARVLDVVEMTGVPLRDALERLRGQAGVNLFVSWNVLARAGVNPDTPVDVELKNVTLGKVLDLVLADAAGGDGKLAWASDDEGVVRVSTFADIERGVFLRRERETWRNEMRMHARLERRIGDVGFDRTPLWKALETIETEAGLKLVVPWRAIETAGIGRSEPISLKIENPTAAAALSAVLGAAGQGGASLGYVVRGDIVEVSTYEGLRRLTDTRVYDVSDLLAPLPARAVARGAAAAPATARAFNGADEIRSWIQDMIDPDSWRDNGGSVGMIRVLPGRFEGLLLVAQTWENHRGIARVLSAVRGHLPEDPAKEPEPPNFAR